MNVVRVLLVCLAGACLAACGSNDTVDDRYYSLVLAAGDSASEERTEPAEAMLIVGPVELPRYLGGRGLSMQVGPNRIETANHHFWAEPLDEAIAKVLAGDIAERTTGFEVEREAGRWNYDADCRVRVEFDAFHPTYQSEVVVSGRFWIVNDDDSTRGDFSLRRGLTSDGYAHAVDVLRGALGQLADQVSESIAAEPGCGD